MLDQTITTKDELEHAWKQAHTGIEAQGLKWKAPHLELFPTPLHPYSPFYTKNVGCILMAGGVSSRLKSDVPKGMTPLFDSGLTLFEIFLRRGVGFERLYHRWPFFAIMTSEKTDRPTREFLQKHEYFGIPQKQVSFFIQDSLWLLDEKGFCFQEGGKDIKGPNGNGKLFDALMHSSVFDLWDKEEVQACTVMNIDNPLMDPFLPALFRPILEERKEASIATILRASEEEKTGILVERKGHLFVLEYSEVSEELKYAKDKEGKLLYPWANISVFCLKRQLIESLSLKPLPLHFAKKVHEGKKVYKPEYFIFDLFPFFTRYTLVPIERRRYFSPIKSKLGEDSLEEAQIAFRFLQEDQAKQKALRITPIDDPATLDPAALYR